MAAERAVVTYGLPRDVDALTALDEELKRTAGAVEWLVDLIRQQDPAALAWGVTERVVRRSGEFPGVDTRYTAAPNVWIQLLQAERKHLLDVGRTVVSLGLAERQVRMSEAQGEAMFAVFAAVLDDLDLTADQRAAAPAALVRQVRALVPGADAGLAIDGAVVGGGVR